MPHYQATMNLLIEQLFVDYFGEPVQQIISLAQSGSSRQYYRILGNKHTAIAAHHSDEHENRAFIALSQHFGALNLNVPKIYAQNLKQQIYLQQDLGDETLLHRIKQWQQTDTTTAQVAISTLYRAVIDQLIKLQVIGHQGLNYDSICVGRTHFDKQALLWDMQYFKYCFLKPMNISYNEQKLEDDFARLSDYLSQTETAFFMLRDCQARNIMWYNEQPYFIDYQGGMQGALQYDLASLLFQAQAKLSPDIRSNLLTYYTTQLQTRLPIDVLSFKALFYGYAIARTLQVLGAYGLRGLYEQKEHFLQSIPQALDNLQWLLQHSQIPIHLPELETINKQLHPAYKAIKQQKIMDNSQSLGKNKTIDTQATTIEAHKSTQKPLLQIRINSFSYRVGIPPDPTGHGVGFVFDCRAIHNPGRYEPYKHLSGQDQAVIAFLENQTDIADYLTHVFGLIDKSIQDYSARGFEHLTINFGCTGGQHRSVYCAEMTQQYIQSRYKIKPILTHSNQQNWQKQSNMKKINIAIDGYAACGKSSTAKELAKRLGYIFIDSGAMYRAVTLYFLQYGIALNDKQAIQNALNNIHISFAPNPQTNYSDTYLNGENVEQRIRQSDVSNAVSQTSAIKEVRHFLVAQQQQIGANKGVVMDGRDIGTIVFPDAALKIFMTAQMDVRTQRRYEELKKKNMPHNLAEIAHNLAERDYLDSNRTESPLRQAPDAILLDNSTLTPKEQLDIIYEWALERMK